MQIKIKPLITWLMNWIGKLGKIIDGKLTINYKSEILKYKNWKFLGIEMSNVRTNWLRILRKKERKRNIGILTTKSAEEAKEKNPKKYKILSAE